MKQEDYSSFANRMAKKSRASFEVLRPCPLCGSMLRRGETVHTVVYSGSGKKKQTAAGADSEETDLSESEVSTQSSGSTEGSTGYNDNEPKSSRWSRYQDSLVHMHGCRHCYPPNSEIPRTCPVCSREVPVEGYVFARMFQRQGRSHLHVLGCTQCRGPKSRKR